MPLKGDDDDTILKNYKIIQPDLQTVDDGKIKLAGLQPIASELTGTIGDDQKRAEVAAIPLVAVVLFFVFGTVIAASLPALIGGLTIMGALGIMRLAAEFTPVHFFAQPVVTLIGLGIAIDYGLFIVSRFREELAEGYDTEAAVRRTMMTSGRTVMFSAVIIVASSVPLLLFPQGFLKSITYAIIASVMLAAIMSNTVLIAALAVLGHRVDSLGVSSLTKFALPDTIQSDPSNPKKNTLALAAIPTGILLPPVGIAIGHIARTQIKKTGEQGAGLAYIGLVFAYLGLYGGLAYGCYALRDAGIIEGALFWILLGIVIFCATVTAILVAGAVHPADPQDHRLVAELPRREDPEDQDPRRGREGLLGHARQQGHEAAGRVRPAHRDRHDPAGHSAGSAGPRRHQREVPAAGQRGASGAERLRLQLPRLSHREADAGRPGRDARTARAGEERGVADHRASPAPGTNVPSHPTSRIRRSRSARTGNRTRACRRTCPACCRTASRCATTPPRRSTNSASMSAPKGVTIWVGGTPALEQDSIHSLFAKLPLMVVVLILTTTVLMFLAFGSLVLPIKAALMSALTLGSTMGILTWMFVDGHGSGLMNYTPQPLMAPMIGLIIAVIWGLSTDYEVFLVSRMVEARARGLSTAEAIRIGTATTGRLITGAALILAVVAGAFVFSDLVMMKYLAFGLLLALLLDATIIRMFLVPAIMKMLGDDCWWAPQWMKRIQERLGLGEVELPDERKRPTAREAEVDSEALVGAGAPMRALPPHDPDASAARPAVGRHRQGRPAARQPAVGGGDHAHPDGTAAPAAEPPTTRMPTPRPPTRPPGCRRQTDAATTRTPRVDPGRTATPRTARPGRGPAPRVERHRQPRDRILAGRSARRSRRLGTAGRGHAPADAPVAASRRPRRPTEPPTTAIPPQRPPDADPTEKIDTREASRGDTRSVGAAASALRTCCVGKAGSSVRRAPRSSVSPAIGGPTSAASAASSAAGSSASSTRTALLSDGDDRHGQQRSDDARRDAARGDRQHHRQRVQRHRAAHHQRLQDVRLELLHGDDQPEA